MPPIDTSPYTHDGLHVAQLFADLELAAYNGLAQTPTGLPDVHGVFHDRPPEDCCSANQLWVQEWIPVQRGEFPNAVTATQSCTQIDLCPRVVLSLRRPCAPEPDSQGFVDPDDEIAFAAGLIIDLRAWQCAVYQNWPSILDDSYTNARILYGPVTAVGSGTGCLGWDWSIFLELRDCADCAPVVP